MRGITQASVPSMNDPLAAPLPHSGPTANNVSTPQMGGKVYKPTQLKQLKELLLKANDKCAVIFFTSSTCPPCKLVYPAYDELAAATAGKAIFIKVDLSDAHEIGARYQIRVTPTFWSFLRGKKENEWTGANESQLRGNVNLLVQMANPSHPHTLLNLNHLQRPHQQFATYNKVPPLGKVTAKLGTVGEEPAVRALTGFISTRQSDGAADATLPDMPSISSFVSDALQKLPAWTLFPLVDLMRVAFADARFSGYFAAAKDSTLKSILQNTVKLDDQCPYQLKIVTIHLTCNTFASPVLQRNLAADPALCSLMLQLVTSSLLDPSHLPIRVAAASLAFNIAALSHQNRLEDHDEVLSQDHQVELMALSARGHQQGAGELGGLAGHDSCRRAAHVQNSQ